MTFAFWNLNKVEVGRGLGLIPFLCCVGLFVTWVFLLLLLSKNDKTQNILSVGFREAGFVFYTRNAFEFS